MLRKALNSRRLALVCILIFGMLAPGCATHQPGTRAPMVNVVPPNNNLPRELSKVSLPPYRIEPPDVLMIDAVRIVPKSPYRLGPLDSLVINLPGPQAPPEQPITGSYVIGPGGEIDLGFNYGRVRVSGMTIDEARLAIRQQIAKTLADAEASVTLGEIAGKQQIAGQHLVAPDGMVTLGTYGSVYVVGMTRAEAKAEIERHLSQYLEAPEVAVDVFGYNSKVYYVVTQGAGLGDRVAKFPITGNDTVLDAISNVQGLEAVSSKKIWVARPVPGSQCDVVMPVDWCAVSGLGSDTTNYQLLPGDRVFIAEDKLVATDSALAKIISPIERVFGVTLLGTSTAQRIKFFNDPRSFSGGGGF